MTENNKRFGQFILDMNTKSEPFNVGIATIDRIKKSQAVAES
jgi:hypothetical protein